MQHSIMECCISLIHLFYQGGHYEHDTTYPQQTASTRFQGVLPYQAAQLQELHSHPDRSEHRSPHQRHPSSHLGRCLLHRTQPLLHPSPDHGEKNGKRNQNPDQQRTSGNITVLPENTAFHSRHRLPLSQPQKNRFPTLPIPGLPHCP